MLSNKMADMDELFGSSDNESGSGKADLNASNNNNASDNENGDSDNDSREGGGGSNADSGNENAASEGSGNEDSPAPQSANEDQEDEEEEEDGTVARESGGDEGDQRSGASSDAESNNEGTPGAADGAASDNENGASDDEKAGSDAGSGAENAVSDNENGGSDAEVAEESDNENARSGSDGEQKSENDDAEAASDAENEDDSPVQSENEIEAPQQDADSEEEREEGKNSDTEHKSDGGDADEEEREQTADRGSDDDSNALQQSATAEALFGDADDISSASEAEGKEDGDEKELGQRSPGAGRGTPIAQDAEMEEDEEEEEEEQPEEVPETRIDVEIPKINTDLGKDIHFVKLPNFFGVETRPFDHQTYEDEIDEDEVLDEEGRARLKLKVENTVRWRWGFDSDGNPVKESNTRIVKWSDGSMSLYLGSEIFDVHRQLLQGDHNHLFIRQGTGLQGQAVFRTKLTFRPHSTDSFTHRKITMSVADRSQKTQKIRILPNVGKDPEAHRSEMIKKEEDRLKASIRRESKQRRMRERALSRGLSSSYLEADRYDEDEEDDDGAISLAAIKNRYKKGAFRDSRPPIYSSDSENSDINDGRVRRLEKSKALADSDDEGERSDDNMEPKKKVARIADSDDEEEQDGGNTQERAREEEEEEEEEEADDDN